MRSRLEERITSIFFFSSYASFLFLSVLKETASLVRMRSRRRWSRIAVSSDYDGHMSDCLDVRIHATLWTSNDRGCFSLIDILGSRYDWHSAPTRTGGEWNDQRENQNRKQIAKHTFSFRLSVSLDFYFRQSTMYLYICQYPIWQPQRLLQI